MPKKSTDSPSAARRVLLGLAHKAAQLAGLSDEDRRAVQKAVTGKDSCAQMTDKELRRLLWSYKAKGVDIGVPGPAQAGGSGWVRPTATQWTEIERLALEIGFTDGLDDARLRSFVARTTGYDAVRFLDRHQASRVILGLRRWQQSRHHAGKDASTDAMQARTP